MPLARHLPQNSEFQDSPVLKLSQSGFLTPSRGLSSACRFSGRSSLLHNFMCLLAKSRPQSQNLCILAYPFISWVLKTTQLSYCKLFSYLNMSVCVCFRYIFKEIFKEFYNMIYFSTSFLLEILICHYWTFTWLIITTRV